MIFDADRVLTADDTTELARAVAAAGVTVEMPAQPVTAAMLTRLAADVDIVWLADSDGDEALLADLAGAVVRRSEVDSADSEDPIVEIMLGSYDPPGARLLDLVTVMDRLRRECPWDREQTHASLVRYLVEEAYETIEAIESGDRDHLREELGDLLLQVLFHSRVASEDPDEPFDIDDVAGQIVEKLIRRHPHVFADVEVSSAQDVNDNWEAIKAEEKSRTSAVDGIPPGLPALAWADKVIGRTLSAEQSPTVPTPERTTYTAETLGEVLFALVAAGRAAGLDPEQALRQRVRAEVESVRLSEGRALPDEPMSDG